MILYRTSLAKILSFHPHVKQSFNSQVSLVLEDINFTNKQITTL